jgi:cellulose 1,4-beta-cellobiosidase
MNSLHLLVAFLCCVALYEVSAAPSGNPFVGSDYYINPDYVKEVNITISKNPAYENQLRKAQQVSAAYWIDTISRIGNVTAVLDGAKAQQAKTGKKTLTVFIVYDLPNRDCAAAASNGELVCADSACSDGLNTYKTKYVDPIVALFKKYPELPIVAIVEPDSLGNMATNLAEQKCAQAENAYYTGIAYSISQLSTLPNVYIYLDACHGGWLGWDDNRKKIADIFKKVLTAAGGVDKIRGFATNTANYQPLGSLTSTADPCNLKSQYNSAINEVIYVNLLSQSLASVGITNKGYIIDTGRNGVTNMRKDCSNWCNINHSGLGIRPTSDTAAISGINIIDAFYWLKTPGESDGTSDSSAERYDFHCGSSDSYIPSPQAGLWNSDFFLMLVQNANPAL